MVTNKKNSTRIFFISQVLHLRSPEMPLLCADDNIMQINYGNGMIFFQSNYLPGLKRNRLFYDKN